MVIWLYVIFTGMNSILMYIKIENGYFRLK